RDALELHGRGGSIEEAGCYRVLRPEDFGVDDRAVEVRRRKPLTTHLATEVGHRQADRDLVRANLVGAGSADSVVPRQNQESAHRERVAGACDDHRGRKRQDFLRELEPHHEHFDGARAAAPERVEIEPGGEDARPSRDHDHGAIGLRAVQRAADFGQHLPREGIHLPVVQRDGGDGILQSVADPVLNGFWPFSLFETTLRNNSTIPLNRQGDRPCVPGATFALHMARTLLIDTYSVLFRAHHAPPPMNTRAGLPTAALYGTSSLLLKLLREERPRAMAFALDAPRAIFRHERFEAHKATRKPLPDPLRAQLSRLPELLDAFGSE